MCNAMYTQHPRPAAGLTLVMALSGPKGFGIRIYLLLRGRLLYLPFLSGRKEKSVERAGASFSFLIFVIV